MEHLGRQKIASLTVARKNAKGKKVAKVAPVPNVVPYTRKPITFDLFDNTGNGIREPEEHQLKAASIQRSNERRYSTVTSAMMRKAKPEPDSYVEDIYGSAAPVALARVSIPMAPSPLAPTAPTVPDSFYGAAPPRAPKAPTAPESYYGAAPPRTPNSAAPDAIYGAAFNEPPPPRPVSVAVPMDHLYEDPTAWPGRNAPTMSAPGESS